MADKRIGARLAIVGVLFCLVLIALGTGAYFGSLYSPPKKQYPSSVTASADGADYDGVSVSLADVAFIPDAVERAITNPPPVSGKDRERRELAAQESMAVWSFYVAVFAGISALITTAGTFLIWKQVTLTRKAVEETSAATEAMHEANDIARDSSRRQARAYLFMKAVLIREKEAGDGLEAVLELQNAGNTPGTVTNIRCSTHFFSPTHPEDLLEYDKGLSIKCHAGTPQEIPLAITSVSDPDAEGSWIVLGRIDYQDVFGQKHHEAFGFRSPNPDYQLLDEYELPHRLASFPLSFLEDIRAERVARPAV